MRYRIGRLLTLAAFAALAGGCGTSTSTNVNAPSARCGVNASAQPAAVGAPGGSGSIVISTNRECAWDARSDADWLSLSTTSGQGDATVNFAAAANAQVSERRGVVVVNNSRVEITQGAAACVYTLDRLVGGIDSDGGRLDVRVTSQPGCSWTASSDVPWITVGGGAPGQGTGVVALLVGRHAGFESRTGVVTIAGFEFTVEQGGESPVPPAPEPPPGPTPNPDPGPTPGPAPGPTPGPTPGPSPGPTPGPTPSPGPGPSPEPNPGPTPGPTPPGPTPTPEPCTFTVSPTTASFAADGGSGELVVTASAATCTWTAAAGAPWIAVASPSGTVTGSGRVAYTVAAHASTTRREAPITVAGTTVTIAQAAAPEPCSFTVAPTTRTFPAAGGDGDVVVTASAPTCTWTASSGAGWITIGAAGGTGSGRLAYSVAAHTGTTDRTGAVSVAGTTVSITQQGAPPPPPPCTYVVAPTEIRTTLLGGTFDITIETGSACTWTATSHANWITVNGTGAGTGSGSVRLTVALTLLTGRSGTVTVAGQTVTVTQSPLLVRATGQEDE